MKDGSPPPFAASPTPAAPSCDEMNAMLWLCVGGENDGSTSLSELA